MSTETVFFGNLSNFSRYLRQMCACEGSFPRSFFEPKTGLFCNLETRREMMEYQSIDFACHICKTPYEVTIQVGDPKQLMCVTGTMMP